MNRFMQTYLATLIVGAVCLAQPALAADFDDQWRVTPMVSFYDDDPKRGVDDQVGGGQIGFSRLISEQLAIEFSVLAANLDDNAFNRDQRLRGFGFDLMRHFAPEWRFSPYVLAGIGYLDTEVTGAADRDDLSGSFALGLTTKLGDGWAFRTEARLRSALGGSPRLNDLVYSAGISVPVGKKYVPIPPDSDGDGVNDDADRCPGTPAGTAVDATGCERDSDRDGVVDSKDKCPNTPAGTKVDAKGCPMDSDADGVTDDRDACPNTPRGAKVDARGCELDTDGDGVVDSKDRCPNSTRGVRVDVNGCEFTTEIKLPGVRFELNSARLKAESIATLNDAVATLMKHKDINVEVAGHTDSTGEASYNLDLSKRRARSVLDYLVSKGVSAARLTTNGYGETKPIADNSTSAGRAQNRRVVLTVMNQK